jgi:hypothetical protein
VANGWFEHNVMANGSFDHILLATNWLDHNVVSTNVYNNIEVRVYKGTLTAAIFNVGL